MNEKIFKVERRKAPIVVCSVLAGVTFALFTLLLVLFLTLSVDPVLLVIPVLFGIAFLILLMADCENIKIHNRYRLCVTKGHKAEAKIIDKTTNTIRNAKGYLQEPSWEKSWDTVTVEYQGEDKETYSSVFGMEKAGEIGSMIPVMQYDKYAVFDLSSEKMFETDSKDNICSCGYKLSGSEFICPNCGKALK